MFKKLFSGDKSKLETEQASSALSARSVTQPSAPPAPQAVDSLPPVLGAAAIVWGELCMANMPDVAKLRAGLAAAGFAPDHDATAAELGESLALEERMLTVPLRDLSHSLWRKLYKGVPTFVLLSTAQSDLGEVVFCSALFGGADEAAGARVLEHMLKTPSTAEGLVRNAKGDLVRRRFWMLPSGLGMRAVALSGPEDRDAADQLRALIAFNRAA